MEDLSFVYQGKPESILGSLTMDNIWWLEREKSALFKHFNGAARTFGFIGAFDARETSP